MNDKMDELVQFSPYAGELLLERVPGLTSRKIEHENDVTAGDGDERDMYVYVPRSGCPDAKQCQILMVLRDGRDRASAAELMDQLGLAELAEEEHFLLIFPNPAEKGWNYLRDPKMDSDMDYLNRCFGALRGGKCGVNGFNGMIFYVAATPAASALMMEMAAEKPLNVPAMMIGPLPEDYSLPNELKAEIAACVCGCSEAAALLKSANGVTHKAVEGDTVIFSGTNPQVRFLETAKSVDRQTVRIAWDLLFSQTRRWQNDTYGTYQARIPFTQLGFTAHVRDRSLGCNGGLEQTWYEYVPLRLRGTGDKVPLVFFFHGVNCVPLYGAEQSGWHEIADREGLIVVYPAPSANKAWNIFNDPSMPSDFEFVLALIAHMKDVHPIDESRIYISGFSMGGMMTHALASVYPNIFAAAAPCNAFDFAYFKKPSEVYSGVVRGVDSASLSGSSPQRVLADAVRKKLNYRMPIFQNAGMCDGVIGLWPVDEGTDDVRIQTIARWKTVNNILEKPLFDSETPTGLAADAGWFEDLDKRYYHQRWYSVDPGHPALLELVAAKRMPHAIHPVQIEYAWTFLKRFRRMPDGSLAIEDR